MIKFLIRCIFITIITRFFLEGFDFQEGTWSRFFAFCSFFILMDIATNYAFTTTPILVKLDEKKFVDELDKKVQEREEKND